VREGEVARSQILRELGSSISQIQNASLGESRIRELNDLINRLLRSKYAWEAQIRQLGGPDYTKVGATLSEADGVELPGQAGYRYFGAAKYLPGIRELLEDEVASREDHRKTKRQLLRNIEPDYYGWRDEDDPRILEEERIIEDAAVQQLIGLTREPSFQQTNRSTTPESDPTNPVDIRNIEELQRLILTKRKELLLSKYTSSISE
jgi:pre-mRNA-splicing factor ISY1